METTPLESIILGKPEFFLNSYSYVGKKYLTYGEFEGQRSEMNSQNINN